MSMLSQILDTFFKRNFSITSDADITTTAAPGLMTLLDTALYRTYEGQLTSTVCSANATLYAFLELKSQARALLQACSNATLTNANANSNCNNPKLQKQNQIEYSRIHTVESFARYCVECANEAIARLTTDKISTTANIPVETNDHASSYDFHETDVPGGVLSSYSNTGEEVGLRLSAKQQHNLRRKDCWESTKLFCPDYVWGDEAMLQCQRLVRSMIKHDAVEEMTMNQNFNLPDCTGQSTQKMALAFHNVTLLLRNDLPMRLQQFRRGIESDIVVSKRLYLIKNEYRAPFRSFLEQHMHVQRAPSLSLVMDYIQLHKGNAATLKERRVLANQKIQDCLRNENFVKAIRLEEKCEGLEIYMANMLLPFCEVSRLMLDGRLVVRLVEVPGVLEGEEVLFLQELLSRLKRIMCRKTVTSPDSSTGIRPLLLDLQGIPRDPSAASCEVNPFGVSGHSEDAMNRRIDKLCSQLQCIYEVGKANKLGVEKKEIEPLPAAIKSCAGFESDKFCKSYREWYDLSGQQRELSMGSGESGPSLDEISEEIRKAEIEVSIAMASSQGLSVVLQRIDHIEKDRLKRFEILQEMVEECCLREMDLSIHLVAPDQDCVLELPEIKSAPGLFDPALEMAGELISSC